MSELFRLYRLGEGLWRKIGNITHSVPAVAVLGLDLVGVAQPVAVPVPQGRRVVHTDGVDSLDLKTSSLETVDNEAQGSARVGAGEDVLVHEQTPDEILVLPGLAETSDLQEEDSIVVEHIVDLRQESGEVAHTDVLGHLQAGDLAVAARHAGSITVVRAQNTALLIGDASVAQTLVAPSSLVTAEGDTGDMGAIVNGSVLSQRAPATAEVQNGVTGLDADLLADDGQLVVLHFLEGLFLVDVADQTGGVDHAGAEEPSVEVITAVVVVTDLLLVYRLSVNLSIPVMDKGC